MRILVVNPNTTASMTTAIGEVCRAVAAAETEVTAINPAWGPPSIETFVEGHVAAAAMLQRSPTTATTTTRSSSRARATRDWRRPASSPTRR